MSSEVGQLDASLLGIGSEFAGYRVEAGIKRQSGVGRVYEATHLRTEQRVALKVFAGQEARGPAFRDRFLETAERQAALRHPGIVAIEEIGVEPAPFLVMTLVRGRTLAELIEARALGDDRSVRLLGGVAAALDAANKRRLIYRRLQPHGILVPDEGDGVLLGDFGAGRPLRATQAIEERRLGSFAAYISPEEIDDAEARQRSVVYSLGCIAFECLAGHPPYPEEEQWATLRAHLEAPPRSIRSVRPDLPEELDEVLQRALAKKPRERQRNPRALLEEIDRAYPADAREAAARGRSRRRWFRRKGPAAAAAVAAPEAEAGKKRRSKRRRSRPRLRLGTAALVLLLIAAAAALGAVVSGGPGTRFRPADARSIDSGSVTVRYPANWAPMNDTSGVPSLALEDPVAVAPPGGPREEGQLVAGRLDAGSVPAAKREAVELDGVAGYRYDDLRGAERGQRATLYVVPAQGGHAVAACISARPDSSFAASCERVASTVRPSGETVQRVDASPAYARGVNRVVARVDATRARARRRLGQARTARGQGQVAGDMARALRRQSTAFAGLDAPANARRLHRAALGQLRRASRGYADMARAAPRRATGAWNAARRGVDDAESNFQESLRDLRDLGYDVA